MVSRFKNFTLKDLTFEYFKYEETIQKLLNKKMDIEKQIDGMYNERCEVYQLIKERQTEEEETRKKNLIKYGNKVSLNDK